MQAGDLFPNADLRWLRNRRVQFTGEFRPPKKGEWYISGAIPEGYIAPNDLETSYHIGKLVEVKVETVVTVVGEG